LEKFDIMAFKNALPRTLAMMAVASCAVIGSRGEAQDTSAIIARPAKIVDVTAAPGVSSASYPGVLRAAEQVDLTFPVSGRLIELPVIAGKTVTTGDLIARLEEPRYEARLASAQAEYDKSLADFRRVEELLAKGVTTRREVDTRRAALEVAEASLNAAKEDVSATRLTAPFVGIVARRHVEPFQNVRANEPIVTLQDLSALDVLIHVPTRAVIESDRRRDAVVTIDGLPGRVFPATVQSFSSEPDPVTQTYAVLLRIVPTPGVVLLPGMAATLRPHEDGGDGKNPVLHVPIGAVAADAGGKSYVWLVEPGSGVVRRRDVTLGSMRGDSVEIASGLRAGDRIVAAGLSHVREGMTVRPWTNQP
jgi:multidrug efflux system membrane fusion protein